MKKKFVSLLLAGVMVVTGLIGCSGSNTQSNGGGESSSSAKGEDVTITYSIWDSNQEKELEQWQMNLKLLIQV